MPIRVMAIQPTVLSNRGADFLVNTWHCQAVAATDPDVAAQDFIDDLKAFYGALEGSQTGQAVDGDMTFKAYNLADPEPRAPIVEDTRAMTFGTGDPLPLQLCICMSYRAAFTSGVPKARRRGRVYLGGFKASLADASGLIETTTATAIRDSAETLNQASDDSTTYTWIVYSRVDALGRVVRGGWIDNSFDVQRRRALDMTLRSEWFDGHS